jgi:hypothetical protein
MRLLHQLANGLSVEVVEENLDVDLLHHFYGADGDIGHPFKGTTGAGTMDEDASYRPVQGVNGLQGDEIEDLAGLSEQEQATLAFIREQLDSQQKNHVRHPPIKVPRHHNPFGSLDQEETFWLAFHDATEEEYIPQGYGVCPDEWSEGIYPEIEVIRSGNHKRGELEIGLPNAVWFPRAIRWAQALHILEFCLEH